MDTKTTSDQTFVSRLLRQHPLKPMPAKELARRLLKVLSKKEK